MAPLSQRPRKISHSSSLQIAATSIEQLQVPRESSCRPLKESAMAACLLSRLPAPGRAVVDAHLKGAISQRLGLLPHQSSSTSAVSHNPLRSSSLFSGACHSVQLLQRQFRGSSVVASAATSTSVSNVASSSPPAVDVDALFATDSRPIILYDGMEHAPAAVASAPSTVSVGHFGLRPFQFGRETPSSHIIQTLTRFHRITSYHPNTRFCLAFDYTLARHATRLPPFLFVCSMCALALVPACPSLC